MPTKAGGSRGFRPRGKTAERLEYAEKVGMNISDLVNKCLDDHLKDYILCEIESRKETLRKTLEAPVP